MTWVQGETIMQGLQIDGETILFGRLDFGEYFSSSNRIPLHASAPSLP